MTSEILLFKSLEIGSEIIHNVSKTDALILLSWISNILEGKASADH